MHDDDGASRMLDDLLADRSEQQALEAAQAAPPDDD
jgi:hypothetical protein